MDFQEHKVKKIKHSPEAAYHKIQNWCAYQERSQNETRLKLLSYGLTADEADELISKLIVENFLNEERFSKALVSGKFRIKHWGKTKIRMELKKHKVSDYCIAKALTEIDPDEYVATLQSLIEKKLLGKGSGDRRKDFYILLKYLVSRGFEQDLTINYLNLALEKK